MQSLPLTKREIIALLRTEVAQAQGDGLSRQQALAAVSRRHNVSSIKVDALLHSPKQSEHV
jgi:hypothetical protein